MESLKILKSILGFILAGLFEIGGGYLIWIYLKEEKSVWYILPGGILLVLYGFVPFIQPGSFGKVYAAYGGVFVIMSLMWGWLVDGVRPDLYDMLGSVLVIFGIAVIMYWPR